MLLFSYSIPPSTLRSSGKYFTSITTETSQMSVTTMCPVPYIICNWNSISEISCVALLMYVVRLYALKLRRHFYYPKSLFKLRSFVNVIINVEVIAKVMNISTFRNTRTSVVHLRILH